MITLIQWLWGNTCGKIRQMLCPSVILWTLKFLATLPFSLLSLIFWHWSSLPITILKFCTSLVFLPHTSFWLTHNFFFLTSYTISTSYTIHTDPLHCFLWVHWPKKSPFLVLFGLIYILTPFLCTSSAFSLIKSIMASSMEAAVGTSFHFTMMGGFPEVMLVWSFHCNDTCMFVLEWKFPHMFETSLDSFVMMSFAAPKMTSWCSWLTSLRAKHVICSRLAPGITAPITSKVLPSKFKSPALQPLALLHGCHQWLRFYFSAVLKCTYFYFAQMLFSQPWNWKASDYSWTLSSSKKWFTTVRIGCGCCASGCLLYFHLV